MCDVFNEEQLIPASAVQSQFWLLQRMQPGTCAYHIASVFRLRGDVEVEALHGAFADLVARHPALRTSFAEREGVLYQRIHATLPEFFRVAPGEAVPTEAEIRAEVARAFDLETGPLLRVQLWIGKGAEAVLAWTMHHAITDLKSKEILADELAAAYAHRRRRAPAASPEPVARYADYAVEDEAWQRSAVATQAVEYFARYLSEPVSALALPESMARPLIQSSRGARIPLRLSDDVSRRLVEVARAKRTKPYLVLVTAYAVLLARYSGTRDVALGIPFTNRRREAYQSTVGCFVNTLPLAVGIGEELTFDQLRDQVRAAMLGHHRHQEIAFDQVLRRIKPPRDTSRNPLYQAGFTFEPPMQLALDGVEAENLLIHPGGAQLDVFLTMWEAEGRFAGYLEYAAEIFDRPSMERLLRSFTTLLEAVLEGEAMATAAVLDLPIVDPADRHLILREWNATDHDFGKPGLLHELVREQAARTPERIAIQSAQGALTYQAFQRRAQWLAAELAILGVAPGDRVAIFMDRSVELVLAVHAILLAGAAYVPIDPDSPELRIGYALEDAAPKLVLLSTETVGRWKSASVRTQVVRLAALGEVETYAGPAVNPDAAAYVLFTSGSTGRPKGVIVSHRAICNAMLWMQRAFPLGAEEVLVQTTPYTFDVSTWELLWTFLAGARLVIPEPVVHRDPVALAQLIEAAQVTTIHFVPSMLRVFLEQVPEGRCRTLRRVLCIGEALAVDLVTRFHQSLRAELHNLYGPTEAAVQASWFACDPQSARDKVPIGKPIANTRFYILDARQRPVPVGVIGELYIGGTQVADGYANRPDLTAKVFLADPYADQPGRKYYRTGDLARWLPDGNVEFLGRTDFQVKVRGTRIELGEIEVVLAEAPGVSQVAVVAREIRPGDLRLIAYLVRPGGKVPPAELRAFLGARLPDYMVPQHFVQLESFPTTSSGKLDRGRLPPPLEGGEPRPPGVTSGRTAMEKTVYAVWEHHLGYADFPVDGNFFELGGTSLLAARIAGELQRQLERPVSLVLLFQFPTVESLARHLSGPETAGVAPRANLADRAEKQRQAMARRPKPRQG